MSLRRSLAITRHELRVLRRDIEPVLELLVMPLVLAMFLRSAFRPALAQEGVVGATGAEQAVPGAAVLFSFFVVGYVGFFFFREHAWATWDRLRASPAHTAEILLGKSLLAVAMALAQLTILFGVGVAALDLRIRGSLLGLAAVCVALTLCLVTLGLALTAVCRTFQQLNAAVNLSAMALAGLGGAIVPISQLPGWSRHIAPAVPNYWAMQGFRTIILQGGGLGSVALDVIVLAGFAAAFAAVALLRFRVEEQKLSWA